MKLFQYPRDRAQIESLLLRRTGAEPDTETRVRAIIEQVRRNGDKAVASLTKKLDGVDLTPSRFRVSPARLKKAWQDLPPELRSALKIARDRIVAYHKQQRLSGFTYHDDLGNRMDQRVRPLRRVAVYVPGWRAAYPSTVLMNIVPARLAGVDEVVVLTPPALLGAQGGQAALAAAWLAGVDEVIAVGGTPGIAALALGTESIERVDKIVGPGNRYIAMAKRLLYGEIDIDMIAGPSEILVLADRSASPRLVAADLLSQAEHDPDAQAVAILIGQYDVDALQKEISARMALTARRDIIRQSLWANGALIRVRTVADAVKLAERKAPEHLEILTRRPRVIADRIRNAGAIFIGPHTPEPMGDYAAGPNHVLPTGGTARFFSPLSVWSFLKTSHVIECSKNGFEALADTVETLARAEGLQAHAEAVSCRRKRS